jgi:hypothetical protein
MRRKESIWGDIGASWRLVPDTRGDFMGWMYSWAGWIWNYLAKIASAWETGHDYDTLLLLIANRYANATRLNYIPMLYLLPKSRHLTRLTIHH